MTSRVAVIGDIAGHCEQLVAELARLGVSAPEEPLPPDLVVIQVGDLVHKGPDSAGVVALVDSYMNHQPGQWIQLIGNHEALYLDGPTFRWDERLDRTSIRTIRRWWRRGQARVACSVESGQESFLVTHAGLTSAFWRNALDAAPSADAAARRLNALSRRGSEVFRAGCVLRGGQPDPLAGPMWADCTTELIPSWIDVTMPFSQIHGHSSTTDWSWDSAGVESIFTFTDPIAKHEHVQLRGGRLIGVDPGHHSTPNLPWRALEFADAWGIPCG